MANLQYISLAPWDEEFLPMHDYKALTKMWFQQQNPVVY